MRQGFQAMGPSCSYRKNTQDALFNAGIRTKRVQKRASRPYGQKCLQAARYHLCGFYLSSGKQRSAAYFEIKNPAAWITAGYKLPGLPANRFWFGLVFSETAGCPVFHQTLASSGSSMVLDIVGFS